MVYSGNGIFFRKEQNRKFSMLIQKNLKNILSNKRQAVLILNVDGEKS